MKPFLLPRLLDPDRYEPGLFVGCLHKKRAFLFDLGPLTNLANRDILKVTDIFITHTHMDHFMGFDYLLRLYLGKEAELNIYGPENIIKNVDGKLRAYTWNLVHNYEGRLLLKVHEITPYRIITEVFDSRLKFTRNPELAASNNFNGTILEEPWIKVKCVHLDHQVPCLGFAMEESYRINIVKKELEQLGLAPGSWLSEFKEMIYKNQSEDTVISIKPKASDTLLRSYTLGELKRKITKLTRGMKLAYITDVIGNDENFRKIKTLITDSDILFIEAGFLEQDAEIAKKTYHLTAMEAGTLAGDAKVRYFQIFHYSFRYKGMEQALVEEANKAYRRAMEKSKLYEVQKSS